MFCLATKILTYLPFFYLIIFMTSNCQDALASRSEPTDGWRTEELDPKLWNGWRKMIQGDRLEIAEYDLTAKVSQGDSPSDKPGVVEGLKQRIRAYNFSKQRTSSIAVI